MGEQGRGKETTPDTLAIVDRLAGWSKVIPPAVMEQALWDTGQTGQRACRLSHCLPRHAQGTHRARRERVKLPAFAKNKQAINAFPFRGSHPPGKCNAKNKESLHAARRSEQRLHKASWQIRQDQARSPNVNGAKGASTFMSSGKPKIAPIQRGRGNVSAR